MLDFEAYLRSIDWVAAIAVAAGMVVVGLVALRVLTAATVEVGTMLPGALDAAGHAILDVRAGLPADSWVCTACRSVNRPTARRCYRGCGVRDAIGRLLPEAPDLVAAHRNGRRA